MRGAKPLYRTGVWATYKYGLSTPGVPPTTRQALRRVALQCTLCGSGHGCARTLLMWHHSSRGDPAEEVAVAQIADWLQVWADAGEEERFILALGWPAALCTLRALPPNPRWGKVAGMIVATVTILLEFRWTPIGPVTWLSPDGRQCTTMSVGPWAPAAVLAAFRRTVPASLWAEAGHGEGGTGLATYPPLVAPHRVVLAACRRAGESAIASSLEAVVAGVADSDLRFNDVKLCLLCGHPYVDVGEALLHRY